MPAQCSFPEGALDIALSDRGCQLSIQAQHGVVAEKIAAAAAIPAAAEIGLLLLLPGAAVA